MGKFISDDDMAKLEASSAPKGFISDSDMEKHEAQAPQGWGEYVGRGVTGALPVIGGAGGGMLGSSAGPVGALGGAGLGYAGGKEAERLANGFFFGDKLPEESALDATKRVGTNVAEGAAAEAGGQALGKVAGSAIDTVSPYTRQVSDWISNKLGRGAENIAVRHMQPTAAQAYELGPEKLREVGREALDSGSIQFGRKVDTTANNLADARDAAGAVKGAIVENSDATIDPRAVADRFGREVIDPLRGTAANQHLIEGSMHSPGLENTKDAFLRHYGAPEIGPAPAMTPAQLEAEKMAVNENINWGKDPSAATKAKMGWSNVLKSSAEDAIDDPAFTASKRAYENLDVGTKITERSEARHGSLSSHITDVGLAAEAGREAIHGNLVGVPLVALRALTKGRVASSAAVVTDKVSKLLTTSPEVLGQYAPVLKSAAARGTSAFATTNFLLQQSDPGFQELMRKVAGEPDPDQH